MDCSRAAVGYEQPRLRQRAHLQRVFLLLNKLHDTPAHPRVVLHVRTQVKIAGSCGHGLPGFRIPSSHAAIDSKGRETSRAASGQAVLALERSPSNPLTRVATIRRGTGPATGAHRQSNGVIHAVGLDIEPLATPWRLQPADRPTADRRKSHLGSTVVAKEHEVRRKEQMAACFPVQPHCSGCQHNTTPDPNPASWSSSGVSREPTRYHLVSSDLPGCFLTPSVITQSRQSSIFDG